MNNITSEIVTIKTEVREQNREAMMFECQSSGLSVKEWCVQNGINPSTYYSRLRKLREKVCREIVPVESPKAEVISEIRITSGEIVVNLPVNTSAETISTVLRALKSC